MDEMKHLICIFRSTVSAEAKCPYFQDQHNSSRITCFDCIVEFSRHKSIPHEQGCIFEDCISFCRLRYGGELTYPRQHLPRRRASKSFVFRIYVICLTFTSTFHKTMSLEHFFLEVWPTFSMFWRKTRNFTKSHVTLRDLDKTGSVPPSP